MNATLLCNLEHSGLGQVVSISHDETQQNSPTETRTKLCILSSSFHIQPSVVDSRIRFAEKPKQNNACTFKTKQIENFTIHLGIILTILF